MADELETTDAEWAEFYQRQVTAMIAAGQAYVDAGGMDEKELEAAILSAWPDASGSAFWQARVRINVRRAG